MYQNVQTSKTGNQSLSVFVDPLTNMTALFSGKASTVNVGRSRVPMVNIAVRLTKPTVVSAPECDPCQTDVVNTTAEVRLNISKGDLTTLTALKTEVNAFFDKAVADYNLAHGLVPPASASIE